MVDLSPEAISPNPPSGDRLAGKKFNADNDQVMNVRRSQKVS
jgi:hypothetical protein